MKLLISSEKKKLTMEFNGFILEFMDLHYISNFVCIVLPSNEFILNGLMKSKFTGEATFECGATESDKRPLILVSFSYNIISQYFFSGFHYRLYQVNVLMLQHKLAHFHLSSTGES
ncbi:hypothetical protein ACTFIW_005877, partial [Dictyostelium discoideum]